MGKKADLTKTPTVIVPDPPQPMETFTTRPAPSLSTAVPSGWSDAEEMARLRGRVAELEAFIRESVHVGLNYTKANDILRK